MIREEDRQEKKDNPVSVRIAPVTRITIEQLVDKGYAKSVSGFITSAIDRYIEVCQGQ